MSIHQTKDGRWFVAYRDSGDRRVKRHYCGRGPEGKIAAKQFEGEWQTAKLLAESGPPGPAAAPPLTFRELADRYLKARPLTRHTRINMGYALNRHALPVLGSRQVSALSMSHLVKVDEAMAAAGLSMGTRNRVRAYCRAICQWGSDNELIAANPFAKFRPETKKEGRAPDLIKAEELKSIYDAASPHLQWVIEIMLNTGVRPGGTELFALRMEDVDFDNGGIWLARSKTHEKKKSLLPLRPEFLAKIKDLARQDPSRVWLVEYKGAQVGSLKTSWRAAKRRAGVSRPLRLYDLRHWYATSLLSGGADLKAASELMGHSNPTTTMRTYYHLLDHQKRAAVTHLNVPDLSAPSDKPSGKPPHS